MAYFYETRIVHSPIKIMMKKPLSITGLAGLFLLAACKGPDLVEVADIFGDNMVLQAETFVTIW